MIKNMKQMFVIIGIFTLVLMLTTVTYAFFNYTRTGAANRISVGDIYFTSSYDEVTLDGVFPIAKSTINSDTDNVMSVDVDIEGHTTYANGLYYEVKASDVNLTVNGKNIPIGISVTSNNLDNLTLTNYEDGKVLTNGSLFANGRILATIGTTDNSVDGTITIKAYLDKDVIAISDTYNGLETDLMGTTNDWVGYRYVFTTEEWNSLVNTPLSFKIKVEAYENDVSTLVNGTVFNGKIKKLSGAVTPEIEQQLEQQVAQMNEMLANATEEEIQELLSEYGLSSVDELPYMMLTMLEDNNVTTFERVTEEPNTSLFTEDNIVSTPDSIYPIYVWYDNGVIKYYSKSNNIRFNEYMDSMFLALTNLTDIGDLSNIDTKYTTSMNMLFLMDASLTDINGLANWNTSNVVSMGNMFSGCSNLTSLNALSNWNTINLTSMTAMFKNCSSLTNVNALSNWNMSHASTIDNLFEGCTGLVNIGGLSNWDVSSAMYLNTMFSGCTSLADISALSNWNISKAVDLSKMFSSCTSLTTLSALSNWNTSKVKLMNSMFYGCTGLTNLNDLSSWNTSSATTFAHMFNGCTNITNLNGLSNWNTSNVESMYSMFYGCTSINDAQGINDWDINKVKTGSGSQNSFYQMFNGVSTHPEFTKRAGTWNAQGTFIPSA